MKSYKLTLAGEGHSTITANNIHDAVVQTFKVLGIGLEEVK